MYKLKNHQVVLESISDNMAALIQNYQYCANSTINTATMGYYMVKFMPEPYILQEETMYNGKISTAGKLVFKYQYMNCTQDNTEWYWEKNHKRTI